jgi:Fe-S cluster assembly iron-binding protein IscA
MAPAAPCEFRFANCFKSAWAATRAPPVPDVLLKIQTEERQIKLKMQATCNVSELLQQVMFMEGYWPNTPADMDFHLQRKSGEALVDSASVESLDGQELSFVVEQLEAKPVEDAMSKRRLQKCGCTVNFVCPACEQLPERSDGLVRFASRISMQSDALVRMASRLSCGSCDGLVRLNSKVSCNSWLGNVQCQ